MRIATIQDNEQLIDLCRAAPMEGVITAFVDQSPDFFAMPSIQGENFKVWVEEYESKIAACIVETHKTINYNGKTHKAFYFGDLKVRPENRGTLGLRMSSQIVKKAKDDGFAIGECFVIDGNDKMMKVIEYLGTKIYTHVLSGKADICQIMPFRTYSVPKGYVVRNATESDMDAICRILEAQYKDYTASPVFTKNSLSETLYKTPGFSVENFRVAEKNGEIVAVAAFWDQGKIRRTVVKKFSSKAKLAINTLKLLKPFFAVPGIPKEGDPLEYIYLRFPAVVNNDIHGLKAIVASESNDIKKLRKYHFIWAGFHEADNLSHAIKGMWKMSMKVNIIHFKFNEEVELIDPETHKTKPVYVDFSVV
jgi:hypothetical protein